MIQNQFTNTKNRFLITFFFLKNRPADKCMIKIITILEDYWSINSIQLELVIEFTENF